MIAAENPPKKRFEHRLEFLLWSVPGQEKGESKNEEQQPDQHSPGS